MTKQFKIAGQSLFAEGKNEAELQADMNAAKWYAEQVDFDIPQLMAHASQVTAIRVLIMELNKALGIELYTLPAPTADYSIKEQAAVEAEMLEDED